MSHLFSNVTLLGATALLFSVSTFLNATQESYTPTLRLVSQPTLVDHNIQPAPTPSKLG
jgi:hypothetical protein